jgi:hypothetical protein
VHWPSLSSADIRTQSLSQEINTEVRLGSFGGSSQAGNRPSAIPQVIHRTCNLKPALMASEAPSFQNLLLPPLCHLSAY